MNKFLFPILCIICIVLTECKSSKPATAPAPLTAKAPKDTATLSPVTKSPPDEMATAIANGQTVFQNKCYQCHALPKVTDYTQSEWSDIMVKMSRKAHLSDIETNQVLAFVNASAKQ